MAGVEKGWSEGLFSRSDRPFCIAGLLWRRSGVVSEEFLRFADAPPPGVRAACAVGDGKVDGSVPPDHVGDVVGTNRGVRLTRRVDGLRLL